MHRASGAGAPGHRGRRESAAMPRILARSAYGQGLVEYALVICLVAIAVVALLTAMGGKVKLVLTSITGSL